MVSNLEQVLFVIAVSYHFSRVRKFGVHHFSGVSRFVIAFDYAKSIS